MSGWERKNARVYWVVDAAKGKQKGAGWEKMGRDEVGVIFLGAAASGHVLGLPPTPDASKRHRGTSDFQDCTAPLTEALLKPALSQPVTTTAAGNSNSHTSHQSTSHVLPACLHPLQSLPCIKPSYPKSAKAGNFSIRTNLWSLSKPFQALTLHTRSRKRYFIKSSFGGFELRSPPPVRRIVSPTSHRLQSLRSGRSQDIEACFNSDHSG